MITEYNNYITESKKEVVDVIRELEFDKYLIEKLRKVDYVEDVNENDIKTFKVI